MMEMPYEGDNLSMVVILPDESDGITSVEASLTAETLQSDIDSLNMENLHVSLPTFRFHDKFKLKDSLQFAD